MRYSKDKFKDELNYLEQLYQLFISKDIDVPNLFNEAVKSVNKNSKLCRYLNGVNKILSMIKNLVASDRVGNLHGHLETVQDLLQIFRETGFTNYL